MPDNGTVPGNVLDVELGVTQQCVGITRTGAPFETSHRPYPYHAQLGVATCEAFQVRWALHPFKQVLQFSRV